MVTANASPVLLILGAGANIGAGVARAFAAKGYRVALTSRTVKNAIDGEDYVHIQGDLTKPESIADIFDRVRTAVGLPSVVVYNAGKNTFPGDKNDPFALSIDELNQDLAVNTISVFTAAHQSTLAFDQLPASASKTFIYTGNKTNVTPLPPLLSIGVGKSASAAMINYASHVYEGKGYKWYYADERRTDGAPVYSAVDGDAHGKMYLELAEKESQGPWLATFVKGKGYVDFKESIS